VPFAVVLALVALALPHHPGAPSRAAGEPWDGRLINGVELPELGPGYMTWDPIYKRVGNRSWRRWGTDRLITTVTRIAADYSQRHPDAPPILIGDLSRPDGGDFGKRFGGLGHASHQNGQDVDIYYPRKDKAEKPATKVSQVDRRLAQDLVDRFVAAGAQICFVGPRVGLHGPRGRVQKLVHHDDHVHVRWPKG
jgi:murein endopeptidase